MCIRDRDFSYQKGSGEEVLKDIDLHIKSGETIGIVGGTGSGKTSLVNLISRLYDATEGEVRVGGRNVKDYDLEALRNQVAVVLQKNEMCIRDSYKDDATAFNGEKKGQIAGKGAVNNVMSNIVFQLLEQKGVPTHFVEQLSDRETVVKAVKILPLEVIMRNRCV